MTDRPDRDPDPGPSTRRLWLIVYPFVFLAVWINLWMAGLLGPAIGLPAISPRLSLILAPFLSVPATVFAVRWVRGLLDQAR